MSLKTYSNRCRCCLERFFDDEKISKITNFFEAQFRSFTLMPLLESDMLSKHVCEFCHSELLRFSVFKKDLIEKQQKLYELLKQHQEKDKKNFKIKKQEPVMPATKNGEIPQIKEELTKNEKYKESFSESSEIESEEEKDDEKDDDFYLVKASEKTRKLKTVPKIIKVLKLPATPQISSEKKFNCDYCCKGFKAKQGLTRHVQSHIQNSIPWKCDENRCEFATSSKIKLNLHKLSQHGIPIPLSKSSNNISNSQVIIVKQEKTPTEFKCFCGVSFETILSLRAHKNRLHGNRNKCIYGCVNVQYVKTGHWIRHVANKHPEKLGECLKSSQYNSSIKKSSKPQLNSASREQIRSEDTSLFLYCDKCEFKTTRKSQMKSHIESHLPYDEREKFECDRCDKVFTRPTSLRVHRETIHEQLRKYKCPKCPGNVSFKQLGHLNDHVASKHLKINKKNFKCSQCDRYFLKRYMMNKHQRLMHKVDPRQISLVPLRVKQKNVKKVKPKKKNSEESRKKKYNCPVEGCAQSFIQRCNLFRHQKDKGHLMPEDILKLRYHCECKKEFFTYRGYAHHCDKTKCKRKPQEEFDEV